MTQCVKSTFGEEKNWELRDQESRLFGTVPSKSKESCVEVPRNDRLQCWNKIWLTVTLDLACISEHFWLLFPSLHIVSDIVCVSCLVLQVIISGDMP